MRLIAGYRPVIDKSALSRTTDFAAVDAMSALLDFLGLSKPVCSRKYFPRRRAGEENLAPPTAVDDSPLDAA